MGTASHRGARGTSTQGRTGWADDSHHGIWVPIMHLLLLRGLARVSVGYSGLIGKMGQEGTQATAPRPFPVSPLTLEALGSSCRGAGNPLGGCSLAHLLSPPEMPRQGLDCHSGLAGLAAGEADSGPVANRGPSGSALPQDQPCWEWLRTCPVPITTPLGQAAEELDNATACSLPQSRVSPAPAPGRRPLPHSLSFPPSFPGSRSSSW